MDIQSLVADVWENILSWLCSIRDRSALPCVSKTFDEAVSPRRRGAWGDIAPHHLQTTALRFILKESSVFVNMPMGSGKTALALAWGSDICRMRAITPTGVVFICVPPILVPVWRREIERVFSGIPGFVRDEVKVKDSRVYYPKDISWLSKSICDMRGKIVLFTPASKAWLSVLQRTEKRVLVVDEAHRITKQRGTAIYHSSNGFESRLLISATSPRLDGELAMIRGWEDDGSNGLVPLYKMPHEVMVSHLPLVKTRVAFFTSSTSWRWVCADPPSEVMKNRGCFGGLGGKLVVLGQFPYLHKLDNTDFATMREGKPVSCQHSHVPDLILPVFYDQVRSLTKCGYTVFPFSQQDDYVKEEKAALLVNSDKGSVGLDFASCDTVVIICDISKGYTAKLQQAVGRVVRPTNKKKSASILFLQGWGANDELNSRLLTVDFHCLKSFQDMLAKSETHISPSKTDLFRKCKDELKDKICGLGDEEFLLTFSAYRGTARAVTWAAERTGKSVKETEELRKVALKELRAGAEE